MSVPYNLAVFMAMSDPDGSAALPAYLGIASKKNPGNRDLQTNLLELYDELRPPMGRYLSCVGLSRERAEDVIQETFLRLYRHLLAGRPEENLRAWIFRVAHNLAADLHKSDRRTVVDSDSLQEPGMEYGRSKECTSGESARCCEFDEEGTRRPWIGRR